MMRPMRFPSCRHAAFSSLVLLSCADDSASSATTPITFWAFENQFTTDPQVVQGAVFSFDPPGGGARIEKEVAADGHATFEADFSKGSATVTAFAPGYAAITALRVTPEAVKALPKNRAGKPIEDLPFLLLRQQSALTEATARLSGALANKELGTIVHLGPSVFGALHEGNRANYDLRVHRGESFFLSGWEIELVTAEARALDFTLYKHFRIDHGPAQADAVEAIDLASVAPLPTPATRAWHVVAPGGASGPFGSTGRAACHALSEKTGQHPGLMKKVGPATDDASYDCEIFVSSLEAPARTISRALLEAPDHAISVRLEEGIAPDGFVFDGFLLPPPVTMESFTPADPVPVDGITDEVDSVRLDIVGPQDPLWFILANKVSGALPSSITLPPPPGRARASQRGARAGRHRIGVSDGPRRRRRAEEVRRESRHVLAALNAGRFPLRSARARTHPLRMPSRGSPCSTIPFANA